MTDKVAKALRDEKLLKALALVIYADDDKWLKRGRTDLDSVTIKVQAIYYSSARAVLSCPALHAAIAALLAEAEQEIDRISRQWLNDSERWQEGYKHGQRTAEAALAAAEQQRQRDMQQARLEERAILMECLNGNHLWESAVTDDGDPVQRCKHCGDHT